MNGQSKEMEEFQNLIKRGFYKFLQSPRRCKFLILLCVCVFFFHSACSLKDGNHRYYLKCQKNLVAAHTLFPNEINKMFEADKWKKRLQLFENNIFEGEQIKKSSAKKQM